MTDALDAAWAAAEAALPEDWGIGGLSFEYDDDPTVPNDWQAYAGQVRAGHCRTCNCTPSVGATGPTPAAALLALAARLSEGPRHD